LSARIYTQIHTRRSSLLASIGGVVEQREQQVTDGGIDLLRSVGGAGSMQFDGGSHQLPAFDHTLQIDTRHPAAGMARLSRRRQLPHAVSTHIE